MFKVFFGLMMIASAASAGPIGSSGPGPNAFQFGCYRVGQSQDVYTLSIGQAWPDYQTTFLAIADFQNQSTYSASAEHVLTNPMGPTVFVSGDYTLEINAQAAPVIEDGRTYLRGLLYLNSTVVENLKCEAASN